MTHCHSLVLSQNINPVLAYSSVFDSLMSLPFETAETSVPYGDENDPVGSLSAIKHV